LNKMNSMKSYLNRKADCLYRLTASSWNVLDCQKLDLCWPQWVHFGSQEHNRTSWNLIESHGILWNIMESHGISWNLMEPCGTLQNLMKSHGRFWNMAESSGC
jgi:hypothetical protein